MDWSKKAIWSLVTFFLAVGLSALVYFAVQKKQKDFYTGALLQGARETRDQISVIADLAESTKTSFQKIEWAISKITLRRSLDGRSMRAFVFKADLALKQFEEEFERYELDTSLGEFDYIHFIEPAKNLALRIRIPFQKLGYLGFAPGNFSRTVIALQTLLMWAFLYLALTPAPSSKRSSLGRRATDQWKNQAVYLLSELGITIKSLMTDVKNIVWAVSEQEESLKKLLIQFEKMQREKKPISEQDLAAFKDSVEKLEHSLDSRSNLSENLIKSTRILQDQIKHYDRFKAS